MTVAEALVAFTLAAGLLTVTPGLDVALVLRTAVVEGPRNAFMAGLGIASGCLAWGVVVAFGLGAVFAVSALAYDILRYAGATYLVWLGARMILAAARRGPLLAEGGIPAGLGGGPLRWYGRGLLTNVLNPKIGVFYATLLPQFVPAGVDVAAFSLLLALIHAVMGPPWFAALILATRPFIGLFARPGLLRLLDRLTGGMLVACGVVLALRNAR